MRRRTSQTMLPQLRSTHAHIPRRIHHADHPAATLGSRRHQSRNHALKFSSEADGLENAEETSFGRDSWQHKFVARDLMQPGWCDFCDELVWGLSEAAMICSVCNFMCHHSCISRLRLHCLRSTALAPLKQEVAADTLVAGAMSFSGSIEGVNRSASGSHTMEGVDAGGLLRAYNVPNLEQRVVDYNKHAHGYTISCTEGKFSGRIPIYINLAKPVRVHVGGTLGAHPGDQHEPQAEQETTNNFVHLTAGLCKLVQMDSSMTADDVIVVMLKKMRISSPKSKFALYELDRDSKRSRRLHKTEEPLVLQLLWGTARTNNCPHDDRARAWEEFALIELENFVVALDREEQRFIAQIEREYERRKQRLRALLKSATSRHLAGDNAGLTTHA